MEPTKENKKIIGDAFLDELIEKWSKQEKLLNGNIASIAKIRRETGWSIHDSLDCYRSMIKRHADDLIKSNYSILGPACILYCE